MNVAGDLRTAHHAVALIGAVYDLAAYWTVPHQLNNSRPRAPLTTGELRWTFWTGCSLFRRLFLTRLIECHRAGRLAFFGTQAGLADRRVFLRHLAPVRNKRFVVYAKPPFSGPEAVLAYLSRYTHRVAISNQRLIAFDETGERNQTLEIGRAHV